jgi:hypothetical protein
VSSGFLTCLNSSMSNDVRAKPAIIGALTTTRAERGSLILGCYPFLGEETLKNKPLLLVG